MVRRRSRSGARIIIYFAIAQAVTAFAVYLSYRWRGYGWSLRQTLLCSLAPLCVFLCWGLFWYEWQPDFLPMHWFDRAPTLGSLSFLCIPPFVASWFLFFILTRKVDSDDHAA
jgi:hypothetical protein